MHLLFGFCGDYDVKRIIANDIERHLKYYRDYAEEAKKALGSYIELLRTGKYYSYRIKKFYQNMSVDDLVDLLEEELRLRTTIYKNPISSTVIIEISDYY